MQILKFTHPEDGKQQGVFVCKDGHVLLRDVPADKDNVYLDIARRLGDSLDDASEGPTTAQCAAFLEAEGVPRLADFNPAHIAFGPIPDPDEEADDDSEDIEKMPVKSLRKLATKLGVPEPYQKNREELLPLVVEALKTADASAPAEEAEEVQE